MDRNQPQQQSNIGARNILCSTWKLFRTHFGAMLRFFYLHAGLMLLVLVTAGAFIAASVIEPTLFGSQRGGYRADIILIFCGVPAIVLTALYIAFLHPRAVIASYRAYTIAAFSVPRSGQSMGKTAGDAHARVCGAYWAVVLCRLASGAAAVLLGLGLSAAAKRIFGAGEWLSIAAWTLGVMFFWQTRLPVSLAVPAAVWENTGGFCAVARGFQHYRRVRYAATMTGLFTLALTLLPAIGITSLSLWIAGDDALARAAIAAFLAAFLAPGWTLLLCAADTAVYASGCRERTDTNQWYYCSTSLRNKMERRKELNK